MQLKQPSRLAIVSPFEANCSENCFRHLKKLLDLGCDMAREPLSPAFPLHKSFAFTSLSFNQQSFVRTNNGRARKFGRDG